MYCSGPEVIDSITFLDLQCSLDVAGLNYANGTDDKVACSLRVEDLQFEEQFGLQNQVN